MLQSTREADVVIVGAGVAGLSAAHRLAAAGVTTLVLEAAPFVGGRMATEKVDGFRLDRIGQLLSTAYPELRLTPGLDSLVLRPFAPGVLLHCAGVRHHVPAPRHPGGAQGAPGALLPAQGAPEGGSESLGGAGGAKGAEASGGAGGADAAGGTTTDPAALWDAPVPGRGIPFTRAALVRAAAVRAAGMRAARARAAGDPRGVAAGLARITGTLSRLGATPVDRVLERPELPAGQAFLARGIPAGTVDGFLRPLLAALLCDPDLTTSSRCADVALRAYARGLLCVPEGGAEVLPELLARSLPPDTVRTGVRVTSVSTNKVTTAQHGEFRCRAVLLATDARAAAELLPGLRVPEFHPVTVVHHAVDEPPETGARLLLDADREGPVAYTAVVSHVDPTRAPAGRTLVSSTVLGPPPDDVDNAVRAHLARLHGMSTARWETLAVHHCAEAVPAMRPPHDPRRPVRLLAGLYVCGDHRDASSVQGALHSAHRAARAVLKDLGLGPMHRAEPQPTAV